MFSVNNSIDQLMTWIYYTILNGIQDFMQYMGGMGAELFNNPYIQAILLFFQLFASALFLVGFIIAFFDYVLSYDSGKASIKDFLFNVMKGMMATALFTTIPVKLYQLSIDMENTIGAAINHAAGSAAAAATASPSTGSAGVSITLAISSFVNLISSNPISSIVGAIADSQATGAAAQQHVPTIANLLFVIAFAYGFFKVLFGNIKRGGLILVQICVCPLYIFSLVRGYSDAFTGWCKQVIGLCFTAFVQNLLLVIGLIVFRTEMVAGVGIMLTAAEVPRIAQSFGMETSMKANISQISHTASSIMGIGKTLMKGI